jgi:hypothetical protein
LSLWTQYAPVPRARHPVPRHSAAHQVLLVMAQQLVALQARFRLLNKDNIKHIQNLIVEQHKHRGWSA